MLLSACVEPSTPSQESKSPENSGFSESFRTDFARFVPPPLSIEQNDRLSLAEQSLMQLDAQLLGFRERGLAFAIEDPENPMVCDWLATTTAMPPSYAMDAAEWARQEFGILPNRAARDEYELATWKSVIEPIRQSCLSSPTVSDLTKRFLVSSELRQDLYRERERFVLADEQDSADVYIDRILDMISQFQRPYEGSPPLGSARESYIWSVTSVVRPAIARLDTVEKPAGLLAEFVKELDRIDSENAQFLADDIRREGMELTFHVFSDQHRAFEEQVIETAGDFSGWYAKPELVPPSFEGILYSTPTYPAENQAHGLLEATALFYDNYVGSIKVLEKGRRNWSAMDADARYEWLYHVGVQRGPASFPLDAGAFVLGLVNSRENVDAEELDFWIPELTEKTYEVISSGELDTEQIQFLTILHGRRLLDAGRMAQRDGNTLPVYTEELLSLLNTLVGRADETPQLYDDVARMISQVWRHRDDLGLTDTQFKASLATFPDTASTEIQETITAALNPVDLEPGVPVRFEMPTMDGAPFDTGELEGKIVLIDHWDTNCGPCIAAMPGLHDVYEEYKDRGVEVVSIVYNGTSFRNRVERLKAEMGLTWVTLNGEGYWPAISAQFGYKGVPQYMLLDREGRWIAGTEEMGGGPNFEALLLELLEAEQSGEQN